MDATLRAFRDAVVAHKVVNRVLANETPVAMEFPSDEAMQKYLKEHPKANPSNHSVKDPSAPPKPSKKEQGHAADAAHQKSEEYKTGKKKGYYPQKMPEGMELPSEVKALPEAVQKAVASMPDEDLDKDEAYRNKAVKAFQKQILGDLKAGKLDEVNEQYADLERLKLKMTEKYMDATTDAAADPYRFAARKLSQAWRSYNAAIQDFNQPEAPKAPRKPKQEAPSAPSAKPTLPEHVIDTDIDDQDDYHKSDTYKTKRNRNYYPDKAPPGLKEPETVKDVKKGLSEDQRKWMTAMPDEDLDKDEAYDHPKVKAVSDALAAKVKSGEMSNEDLTQGMVQVQKARDIINDKYMAAKTDEEADEYRFPMRALYKMWQGYNGAMQSAWQDKQASDTAFNTFRNAVIARKVAARVTANRG